MKHIAKMFYLALLCLVMQNCAEKDDATPAKEQVRFSLDLKTIPEGSSLRVSIQKSTGESVLNLQEVALLQEGNIVTTTPIELARGNYKVTDFLIVNQAKEISFATPKKGSPMASSVKNPVDLNFSVQKGIDSKIAMEVINVANSQPGNFGYETFDLDIIHPLKVAVYVPSGSSTKLSGAKAYVMQGTDTLQYFNLSAKVNFVPFKQEVNQSYTLVVVKDSYITSETDFIYSDLAGAPLKITLTESFSFTTFYDGSPFTMSLSGIAGKTLNVDWGDGITESYALATAELTHNYPSVGHYTVNITGDIKFIQTVYSYYGDNKLDKINFRHLTRLKEVIMGWTQAKLEVLDLSNNPNLEFLNLQYLANIKTINLPVNNNIKALWIDGPSKLTTYSLNDAISKLYHATVQDNRHNGSFSFSKSTLDFPGTMMHTPSPASLAMLIDLRDNYGWDIYPNP